jgi:predicted permease
MQPRIVPQWGGGPKGQWGSIPGARSRSSSILQSPGDWCVQPWGRLKAGVSQQEARAALDVIFRQTVTADLASPAPEKMPSLELSPGDKGLNDLRSEFSQPLFILMSGVGLVLLIACANVANLLLARATARQKETAVRLALGARRLRLVRQSLTESMLLAGMGGALGLALAFRGGELLLALVSPGEVPLAVDVRPDARVLVFCAAISLLTGILFGLVPALRATRIDVSPALKGSATSGLGRSRWALGKALVAAQVGMSLLLLIGAGMFVRSLQKLNSIDLGFNRENLLLFGVDGSLSGYTREQLGGLYGRIQETVGALPGVRAVSLSRHALIGDGSSQSSCSIPGRGKRRDEEMLAYGNCVGPGFFETMGIPLLLGRGLRASDHQTAPKVVVINEALARRYFPNESPIGKQLTWHDKDVEIVGVAKDAKYHDLRQEVRPTVYEPYLQSSEGRMIFEVRTEGDPAARIADVRLAVAAVDRNLPLYGVRTQVQQIESHLIRERTFAQLTGCFGALALLLASIGLYGVMSYMVGRRTSEIGIRMALGAAKVHVVHMVLRETLIVTGIGMFIGLPAALATTRLIRNQLFGLTPSDPVSVAVAVLVLAAVAVLAGYVPARRAARIDPLAALRCE